MAIYILTSTRGFARRHVSHRRASRFPLSVAVSRIALLDAVFARYSQLSHGRASISSLSASCRASRNPRPTCLLRAMAFSTCTKFGHPPVDGLHSIENTALVGAHFSLTKIMKSVKQKSFFDSFLSFSGWCGVRGSSSVTLPLQNAQGRQARVYSKALVEENGKPSRRQDRVPRR